MSEGISFTGGGDAWRHLGLNAWPFRVAAATTGGVMWADRKEVQVKIRKYVRRQLRQDATTLNFVWADFGMGKTHLLRYVGDLISQGDGLAHYTVLPRALRTFQDVYRAFAGGLTPEALSSAYAYMLRDGSEGTLPADLRSALSILIMRSDQADIVMQWLRGGRVPLPTLRALGMHERIETGETAARVMTGLIDCLTLNGSRRYLWALDEFQRVGTLRENQRDDINVGLHSLFNAVRANFTIILAFSFGELRNIKFMLSSELIDRANMATHFTLPAMSEPDGALFVRDLLEAFRLPDYTGPESFPFTEGAIATVVGALAARNLLKPRALMQAFDAVLAEFEADIEEGELDAIDETAALEKFEEVIGVLSSDTDVGDGA